MLLPVVEEALGGIDWVMDPVILVVDEAAKTNTVVGRSHFLDTFPVVSPFVVVVTVVVVIVMLT